MMMKQRLQMNVQIKQEGERMRLNDKGLTLIELIVSMLILSIASLMFYASFSVVLRTMKEGADIKNACAEIVAILDGNAVDDNDALNVSTNRLARGRVTLSDNSTILVEGIGYHATKTYGNDDSDNVNLQKFTIYTTTKNEKHAMEMGGILDVVEGNGLSQAFVSSLTDDEKKQIAQELGRNNIWASNDVFIDYLYKKYLKELNNVEAYVWPTIDITKMKVRDGSTISITDNSLGKLTKLYMVPYYIDPKNGLYLLSGRKTPAIGATDWNAYLIYNDDDQHWYYQKSSFGLTSLTNKSEAEWLALKQKMRRGEDGWQRVYEDE